MAGSETIIEIRQLFHLPEFEEVLNLQKIIWGFADIEMLPLRAYDRILELEQEADRAGSLVRH